jgi:hypothetical protein
MSLHRPTKYTVVRETAINSGSAAYLLGFLSGCFYADGRWLLGTLFLLVTILQDNVGSRLWLWLLENIKRKE